MHTGLASLAEKSVFNVNFCHCFNSYIVTTIETSISRRQKPDGHIEEITGSQNDVPAAPKTPSATGFPTTPVNQNTAKPLPSPVSCLG
ncbi:hypothetical protein TNCV_4376251 [Trichonephila clavipes]|nr:hypothetical protein TNCV_4376251 [Trichonephila clavipes]